MNRLLDRARGSARVQRQATRARAVRDRWVDQSLIQLERTRRQLLEGAADVVYLADSAGVSWSPADTDRRLLAELVAQESGARMATIGNPGCGARVYKELIRILATMEQRPKAVLLSVTVRANFATHVIKHPQFSYERTAAALSRIPNADRPIRSFGRGGVVDRPAERERFLATPIHTKWGGDMTVGEFRKKLLGAGPPPWPSELERFRFDYFHGELIAADHPAFGHLTELGRRLAAYGVPVVPFWVLPPLERGEMHFPGEFTAKVSGERRRMEDAVRAGFPEFPPLVDFDLDDIDFEDSQNATEHFRFSGRTKVARAIADRLATHGVLPATPVRR